MDSRLDEKEQFYEMGYACTVKDKAGILILVNTKEQRHARGLPHAHLQEINGKNICNFFITEEIPKTKNDLRFVSGTFESPIPAVFKQRLVDWAKKPVKSQKGFFNSGWDWLKDYWERMRPSGISPSPYPQKKDLEILA